MTSPNDKTPESPNPDRDALHDRLLDQALGEVVGGERPPDLADRILAAVAEPESVSPHRKERVMSEKKRSVRPWILGGVAACLTVGVVAVFAVSKIQEARQTARSSEDFQKLESRTDTLRRALEESKSGQAPGAAHEMSEEPVITGTTATHDLHPVDNATSPVPLPAEKDAPGWQMPASAHEIAGEKRELGRTVWYSGDEGAIKLPSSTGGDQGQGPGRGGDKYGHLVENPFRAVKDHPLSTFSIDVDTASYANVRRFLLAENTLPPPDAVRIEELVNYFDYDYAGPKDDVSFAAHIEVAGCPWKSNHRLVRVGLKGKEMQTEARPASNLVFLLDVSGSMSSQDKLPLLVKGMKLLVEQLREQDRVAIVVYASAEGLALPSTSGANKQAILEALDRLNAGGSTNGGAGIELAYKIAKENFIKGGVNRVLLCTDGDFNVGATSTGDLVRTVEQKAKSGIFLSVLGFGRGNLNDSMMENISNKGNGNYAYIDGLTEARKVLVQQSGGTLVTIAKDVKIQIEFNPARIAAYRLIGYENRMLAAEDFNDDKKDAGEIGAGHTVTALYEIVPVGAEVDTPPVDDLKYQPKVAIPLETPNEASVEMLTLKLRYKQPDGDKSKLLQFPLTDGGAAFGAASQEFQFATSVAWFGMLLRGSAHAGDSSLDAVLETASSSKGPDLHGYRAEFLKMIRKAKELGKKEGK